MNAGSFYNQILIIKELLKSQITAKIMKSKVMKPDLKLYFDAMPLVGIWMNEEYNKANSFEEIANLFHKWLNDADTTDNPVKELWCRSAAHFIYTFFTQRSFESTNFKEL